MAITVCPQKNPIPDDRPAGAFLIPRVVRGDLSMSQLIANQHLGGAH